MSIDKLTERALDILALYRVKEQEMAGHTWSCSDLMLGFVGDVGALAKYVAAHDGVRTIVDHESKLKHELADCLWSLLVLARECDVDLEKEFLTTMNSLEKKLQG